MQRSENIAFMIWSTSTQIFSYHLGLGVHTSTPISIPWTNPLSGSTREVLWICGTPHCRWIQWMLVGSPTSFGTEAYTPSNWVQWVHSNSLRGHLLLDDSYNCGSIWCLVRLLELPMNLTYCKYPNQGIYHQVIPCFEPTCY
jgi:hypothetical protein